MGLVVVMSSCIGCGKTFSFNPHKVPSVRINGVREPVCIDCVNRANPIRASKGLEPIVVLPGAYDHIDENEL